MNRIYLPSNRSPRPGEQRFKVLQPLTTHYGWVSCRDFDCEQFLLGFQLVLPLESDQTAWMRSIRDKVVQVAVDQAGQPVRHRYWFTEELTPDGLVTFTFPPGQPCFRASQHRWHIRPPLFAHERDEMRRGLNFEDFTDLMNNESGKVAREREKG